MKDYSNFYFWIFNIYTIVKYQFKIEKRENNEHNVKLSLINKKH